MYLPARKQTKKITHILHILPIKILPKSGGQLLKCRSVNKQTARVIINYIIYFAPIFSSGTPPNVCSVFVCVYIIYK